MSNDYMKITSCDCALTGNQNMGVQEPFEQKSLQYPRIRTEDSHFFTYFTVTTVACIVCYIGYHNKQKVNLFHACSFDARNFTARH